MRLRPPAWIALAGMVAAIGWAVFVTLPHVSGVRSPVDWVEAALVDLRLLALGPLSLDDPPMMIVAVDDATFATEGFDYPMSRRALGELVERIAAAGAKLVALDIVLTDEGDTDADAALERALAAVPTVIAAAGRFDGAASGVVPQADRLLWPDRFEGMAEVGLVNLVTSTSGTPRHAPLLFVTEKGVRAHLALLAASGYLDASPQVGVESVTIGDRVVPVDLGFHLPLRPVGPNGTIPTLSALQILDESEAEALRGKLVVVGITAGAVGDTFSTPFDSALPGVEVMAGAVGQLLGTHALKRTATIRRIDAVASGSVATAGALALALLPLATGAIVACAALAGWLLFGGVMFALGSWYSAALPLAVALPVFVAVGLARQRYERGAAQRSARAADALGKLQSPALARRIASDPGFLSRPQEVEVAVMFVDIADFTGHSERLGLEGTRSLLKAFHGIVVEEVERRRGVVLNFIGDGVLVVFGLLDEDARDQADRSLATAFALVEKLYGLPVQGGVVPDVRIGLHYGKALASRLGHVAQEQVTIAGDAVNLTSRLLEVAKEYAATIAATAEVIEATRGEVAVAPDADSEVAIRGREARARVLFWRLAAASASGPPTAGG